MKPLLSICIAVYNQSNILTDTLTTILAYDKDDIEIVISDDNSTENIKVLVQAYHDTRIKYYNTGENKGHDFNILFGLKKCTADYALLLRTRDKITKIQIENVITVIKENNNAAYFLFSAIDENEKERLLLSDKIYKCGKESLKANNKLLIHPSGQIYRVSDINFDLLYKYLKNNFEDKYGFIVHSLIRLQLSIKGKFVTSSKIGWIYTNTRKAKDIAQNSSNKGLSVYAPVYEYKRYQCEYLFVLEIISDKYLLQELKNVVRKYYRSSCVRFEQSNKDKELQKHYNYEEISFSKIEESKKFFNFSILLFNKGNRFRRVLRFYLYVVYIVYSPLYTLKGTLIRMMSNISFFPKIYKNIKHL